MKIRQEINVLNRQINNTGEAERLENDTINIDKTAYNDIDTAYMEYVAKNTDSTYDAGLKMNMEGGVLDPWGRVTVPANTNTFTRFRGNNVTGDSDFTSTWHKLTTDPDSSATGTLSVQSARLIIFQNAESITDTQTQIEIGQYATVVPAAASTWYAIPEPKYWKYEASKWDPAISDIKLGITVGCEDDKESYNFGLYDVTDADYKEDLITGVNTEAVTYYESSDFSAQLEDGHIYCLAYEGDDNKDDIYFYNAKIIITQSDEGGISKLQPEYLLINDGQSDTDNQEFFSWWDPDEWDVVSNTYYHEQSASHAASASKVEYDDGGSWTAITSSTAVGTNLQRSASITMPSTEDNIDTDIIASS